MMESSVRLDIALNWGREDLIQRRYPVDDRRFHGLSVVRSGGVDSLRELHYPQDRVSAVLLRKAVNGPRVPLWQYKSGRPPFRC